MKTVLIVDDEADILFTLTIVLETAGFRTVGAVSAEEALTLLESETPDGMLLDLNLPGMDGWALLDVLKADGRLQGLPTIIISAHASQMTSERATEYGCSYLTKPCGLQDLEAALARAVGDGRQIS